MSMTEEDVRELLTTQDDLEAVDKAAEREAAMARAAEREAAWLRVQRRSEMLDSPTEQFGQGVSIGIANAAGIPIDAASAIMNAAGITVEEPLGGGDSIYDVMEYLGVVPEDLPSTPTGPAGGAGEAIGMAAVITPVMLAPFLERAMDPEFEVKQGLETRAFLGTEDAPIPRTRAARAGFLMKQLGQNIARTAVENPKMFAASELVGTGVAGALMKDVEEAGGTPAQQMGAGIVGGVAATMTVGGIPRMFQSAYRWGMRNMIPFSEAGGEARAAAQVQARTEDIPGAVAAIEEAQAVGLPVTPARATGERRLMAQEQHMLEQDPGLDLAVREDLENAVRRSQNELRTLYDMPSGRADWEYAVVQRVAPDGTEITPGTVEDMTEQVFKSFEPRYAELKGYPVRNRLMDAGTTLDTQMKNVPNSRAVMAGTKQRKVVGDWLENQMSGIRKRTQTIGGEREFYDSGDLLKLRSRIRAETRKQRKSTTSGSDERADLLEIAEQRITGLLKDQLPEEAMQSLKTTDDYYRNYKILEDAVYRAPQKQGLTPDSLLAALRASASSKGAYARGEGMELRSLAQAGRPITQIMDSPDQVGRITATMTADDIDNLKSQYVNELFRRSIPQNQFGPDGEELISGVRLQGNRNKFRRTGEALGMTADEFDRLDQIIQQIQMVEKNPEAAVAQLFEDGPSNILELGATLLGAKSGQRLAEGGIGSSMVLASYGANKWRGFLSKFTSDRAEQIMREAVRDPEKFKALLLKPDALPAEKDAAYQVLMAAMQRPAYEAGVQAAEEIEQRREELREEMRRLQEEAQKLSPLY